MAPADENSKNPKEWSIEIEKELLALDMLISGKATLETIAKV